MSCVLFKGLTEKVLHLGVNQLIHERPFVLMVFGAEQKVHMVPASE